MTEQGAVLKTGEGLKAALLTEGVKKEWQNLPDGAWERDLQAMAEILPAGILPLYQTLALDKGVSDKSGSQNRLHLATIAALTETGDKAVWTNKETAGEVMGAVRSALGDRYPELLNEWDEGKNNTVSLLTAARKVVKELVSHTAEEKQPASRPVAALMKEIEALPENTQKRIQALVINVLDYLDNPDNLTELNNELKRNGVKAEAVDTWYKELLKQRTTAAVQTWEKMKSAEEMGGKIEKAGQKLMEGLVRELQRDLAEPEKDPNYYSLSRDWQTKAGYVKTWVGTTVKPGKVAALFGAGEEGVAKAQQAFEIIWTNYLKGMGVVETTVQLPEDILKRLPQYGQKTVEQAVAAVKEALFNYRGELNDAPSLESARKKLLGPAGFLEKALGDPALAQVIFEQIKAKLLAPVEQMIGQGGEQFTALSRGGEKIAGEFMKELTVLIGSGKTEGELLDDPQLAGKFGKVLTTEQRQQLIQKSLAAYKLGAEEALADPEKLVDGITDSLKEKIEKNLQKTLEAAASAAARGDDEELQHQRELWQKWTGAELPEELIAKIKAVGADEAAINNLLQAFQVAWATVKTVSKQ